MASKTPAQLRVEQVLRYLEATYPSAYPVKIHWHKQLTWKEDGEIQHGFADMQRRGQTIIIRMSLGKLHQCGLGPANETIIHEYAHCRDIKHAHLESRLERTDHGPEWGLYYAEMYSDFMDMGGWKASKEF